MDAFSEKKGLKVEFYLELNANAYLIQQIGKTTIADSLSKMFALVSGGYALIAWLMKIIERTWKTIQAYRREGKKRKEQVLEAELCNVDLTDQLLSLEQ